MNLHLPGLSEVLEATKNMPEQFDTLVDRLDQIVLLLETQNRLLQAQHGYNNDHELGPL